MFYEPLLSITGKQKQIKCPSTDECAVKMYTMRYYSALRKYRIMNFAGKQMN